VRSRVQQQADRTLAAVHERLVKEINHQQNRLLRTQDDIAAGKVPRVNLDNVNRTLNELTARLEVRQKELLAAKEVSSATPIVLGGALVIPAGLLAQRRGEPSSSGIWSADAAARQRIERIAMQAVMDTESAAGNLVYDVSAEKCGWDITSQPPGTDGCPLPPPRHIEVKGRALGADTITVTKGEILYGLNQRDKFLLAIVLVDGEKAIGPSNIRQPFTVEPDWATTSINMNLASLLSRAEPLRTGSYV
jgi:hypothetical protein